MAGLKPSHLCSRNVKLEGKVAPSRSRRNKVHLVEKLTLANSLGDQFKSGGDEGGLINEDIMFKSGVTVTFAELP